uniref:Akirin n=1 Tax=Rhabditophanes sp. KR3021 TaxID=114890 RepID=A0AC35U975_9BILA
MTCGLALKRPHDYEAYLSPDSTIESKRSRTSNYNCSPFRPQLGTLAANLPLTSALNILKESDDDDKSVFSRIRNSCKITENQLDCYLKTQAVLTRKKVIAKRRDVVMEASVPSGSTNHTPVKTENSKFRFREAKSPLSSGKSKSTGYSAAKALLVADFPKQLLLEGYLIIKKSLLGSESDSESICRKEFEKKYYSLKDFRSMTKRLLMEQEVRLRSEYEVILREQLAEQHEQYCQFADEQFRANKGEDHSFSYVS